MLKGPGIRYTFDVLMEDEGEGEINKSTSTAEDSMQKFFSSGFVFIVAALLFMVVAALSERPAVYIALGAVFLILGLGVVRKSRQKSSEETPSQ